MFRKLLCSLFVNTVQLVSNERGQVGDDDVGGERIVETGDDLPAEAFEVKTDDDGNVVKDDKGGDTPPVEPKVEAKVEKEPPVTDDAPDELKDKAGLAPELEKHRKGMHRAYTKARERLTAREQELDNDEARSTHVDKFFNDKAYGAQVVQKYAAANGLKLVRADTTAATTTDPAAPLPNQYVEAVTAQLPEELKAFGPAIARASAVLAQRQLAEQQATQQAKDTETRTESVHTLMEDLETQAPGWQEHEEDMIELLDFLESNDVTNKRFGSKAKLLYSIVTSDAGAVDEAATRMRAAARHKGVKPQGSKGPTKIAERILAAKTDDEAWDLANADALEQFSHLPD